MKLSKPSFHRFLPALLVLLLAAGGSVLAANTVITDQGATGTTAPPAEEGSTPPPPPVAAEDSAILICPQGGGKNISYEVSTPNAGSSCTKDSKKKTATCVSESGRVLITASCKSGCGTAAPLEGFCTKSESKVTR